MNLTTPPTFPSRTNPITNKLKKDFAKQKLNSKLNVSLLLQIKLPFAIKILQKRINTLFILTLNIVGVII